MNGAALQLSGVRKRYGKRVALDGLDLSVPKGSIFGLVGSNGAGKTTSLLIAAGLIRPDGGRVDVLGEGAFEPFRLQGRVALMPQDCELTGHVRVTDLLHYFGRLQGLSAAAARASAADVLARCHLADRADSAVRTLSHGMRRRVLIAQALLGDPELVLLDEPLSGLDPREGVNIRDALARRRGRQTLVISSHNLFEVERLCDRIAFIERGRTVREGAMAEVTGRRQLLRYTVKGMLPLEQLRNLLPDVSVETAAAEEGPDAAAEGPRHLVCRFDGARRTPEEVSARVLGCLLDRGVGILEVRLGSGLEDAYLRQNGGSSPER